VIGTKQNKKCHFNTAELFPKTIKEKELLLLRESLTGIAAGQDKKIGDRSLKN
jgi:hypothetical protein